MYLNEIRVPAGGVPATAAADLDDAELSSLIACKINLMQAMNGFDQTSLISRLKVLNDLRESIRPKK